MSTIHSVNFTLASVEIQNFVEWKYKNAEGHPVRTFIALGECFSAVAEIGINGIFVLLFSRTGINKEEMQAMPLGPKCESQLVWCSGSTSRGDGCIR